MERMTARNAAASISEMLRNARAGLVTIITRRGKEEAALVPIDQFRRWIENQEREES